MIPSLVEQVIAARLTGNITAEGASRLLGLSERVARERLALAVERGAMATWRTSQGKRFWGLL